MKVDLMIFMGQSNMAGRGHASDAPSVTSGAGYEFRAISDPERLYPVSEPFGTIENNPEGVFEPGMKTGSLGTRMCWQLFEGEKVKAPIDEE